MSTPDDAAATPLARSQAQAQAQAAGPEGNPPQQATPRHGAAADHDTDFQVPIGEAAAAADPAPSSAPVDPWAPLLEAGLRWVAALTEPPASAGSAGVRRNGAPRVTTDPATGERSLTLPLPDPATLRCLAEGLTGLLARLQSQV